MILFKGAMKSEKIALIALVIIIAGALSAYLISSNYDYIYENLFGKPEVKPSDDMIEYGDYVDLQYIGRYSSNNTIFDSSYNDTVNKTGGSPLQVFVTLNSSEISNKSGYVNVIEGFAEGLIGLKEGESKIIGPIPPEKAYGVKPKIGDILDLTDLTGATYNVTYKIVDIKENREMPEDFAAYLGYGNTTLYELKEDWHYIGETLDFPTIEIKNANISITSWENYSIVTKINDTKIWTYTTPTTDIGEYFTWKYIDYIADSELFGSEISLPEKTSVITKMNETNIVISHEPELNSIINVSFQGYYFMDFVIQNISESKINASYTDPASNDTQFIEFDKEISIPRNNSQLITFEMPEEYLEMILQYLGESNFSLDKLAGESLTFEVEILKIYKSSQEES